LEEDDVAYVVTEGCIDVLDRSCLKVCPVDCIYEGGRMMYINADECIDCGACEPVCPQKAIYFEDDLPDESLRFKDASSTFFEKLGSPGGARKIGKQTHDAGPAADKA
jgi:NAD-dependent dihydropyrimidine dehydrogenase PreA subunit